MYKRRLGYTLVELMVSIAIVVVLVGMLIPAVLAIRQLANRSEDMNNIRQISFAIHNYTSQQGKLPGRVNSIVFDWGNPSTLYNILPFIDGSGTPPYFVRDKHLVPRYNEIRLFLSPSDPSITHNAKLYVDMPTSYCVNFQVFCRVSNVNSVSDGLSQTMGIGQHYFRCENRENHFSAMFYIPHYPPGYSVPYQGVRSGTFADPTWQDVVPKTSSNGTMASMPGRTFQVTPKLSEADGRVMQATYSSGLIVGMLDGHVRVYSPAVSESAFWSAVTPNGGENTNEQ